MGEREHNLDLLKQGVEIWNTPRLEHLNIGPNFTRVDLSFAKLDGVDLSGALLHNSIFIKAELREAWFYSAILYRTNLNGADLSKAHCMHIWTDEANLSEANLAEANLTKAHLRGALLSSAN